MLKSIKSANHRKSAVEERVGDRVGGAWCNRQTKPERFMEFILKLQKVFRDGPIEQDYEKFKGYVGISDFLYYIATNIKKTNTLDANKEFLVTAIKNYLLNINKKVFRKQKNLKLNYNK